MENLTFTLSAPIMHGQNEITELELRPIKGKDLIGLKLDVSAGDNKVVLDYDMAFKLAYKLTGIPAPVLAQMAANDASYLALELQSFLLSGQWTGQTSPQP